MEYFKFNLSFLNTITFTSSTYTELDTYLNGVVKNNLNHNNSFLPLAPTQEELDELKAEIGASYDLMLGDIKPRYEEVLRLATVHTFRSKDTTDSVYGDEEKTGKYYEPVVSSAQAQVKTNGELTTWEDDKVTLSREEDRVLNMDAIKEFFTDIKEEVELYFIDYINLFGDGCEGGRSFNEEQLDAINSGIDAEKVAQIGTNKDNIALLGDALGEVIIDLSGKQDKLTQTQLDAVNSGIDSTKVGQIATNTSDISSLQTSKQDALTTAQLNAVNSGITSGLVTQIGTNQTNIGNNTSAISTINGKIPTQASDTNQLADKNFVNSSIATNTANFIGTFNSVADLEAYSGTLTNNDYAFVVGTDGDGNTTYNRYKWNGSAWVYEYTLNNSSFTASQWASINSGATTTNIGQIATNTTNISLKVNKTTTIAGVDLQDNITKNELLTAINVEDGAEVNVQADWSEADNTKDDYIKNKPTIPTKTSDLLNDSGFLTTADVSNKANNTLDNLGTINPTLTSSSATYASKAGTKYVGGHFVTESWKANDGTMWYRKYSDGFKECGILLTISASGYYTYNLPITFSSTNYIFVAQWNSMSEVNNNAEMLKIAQRNTSSIKAKFIYAGGNSSGTYVPSGDVMCYACGY